MGASLADARAIADAAARSAGVFKVGFNHRHYPGIVRAAALVRGGDFGTPIYARVTYGHGAHAQFSADWRCDAAVPGGGQLLDQGSHVLDLLNWMFGSPAEVAAAIVTGFYGGIDDNVLGLLTYRSPMAAQFHVSWTQWKNRFQFDIGFTDGGIEVSGLGRSYGPHTVTEYRRATHGAPRVVRSVHPEDRTLSDEWQEFRAAVCDGTDPGATAADGLAVMEAAARLLAAAATVPRSSAVP
jgi:predicted dehydrogenase